MSNVSFLKQIAFSALAFALLFAAFTTARGQGYSENVADDSPVGRVARLKWLEGDVVIKRNDADAWEAAEPNLPLVAGDELATGDDGRLEIQFDVNTYFRVGPNSLVSIKTLDDSGIALGVPRGVAIASIRQFDRDRAFFEIDLPQTTVAVLKSGIYRVESLDFGEGEVRVAVGGNGEARVYSEDSGFRLRSGRLARVTLTGRFAGDWDIASYNPPVDDLDRWSAARQRDIDRRLASAYYDKYYDYSIYGADDLDGYGSWQFTSDYGYVWQPYSYAINTYNDWSPYRYGRWRWIPPIGWTWVGDEPWGWATYHYGRWVWYRGRWVWTPYGYYRTNRSRWYPALVAIYVVNNNVCWYPLGYRQHYRRFNNYHDWVGNRDRSRPPAPIPNDGQTAGSETRLPAGRRPPLGRQSPQIDENTNPGGSENRPYIPPNAIIAMRKEAFLNQRREASPAQPDLVRILTRRVETDAGDTAQLPPPATLPTGNEIRRPAPPLAAASRNSNTGAAPRTEPGSIDEQLRRTRILGGRSPLPAPTTTPSGETERPTGAVTRGAETRRGQSAPLGGQPGESKRDSDTPIFRPRQEAPRFPAPGKVETPGVPAPPKQDSPPFNPTPRREAPPKQDSPPFNPMPRREAPPKQDSPPFNPMPRREAPPPAPPKQQPPPPERKEEPPPQKPPSRVRSKDDGGFR